MNITPVIPDGYNGPVKQLTCQICSHLFYLAMADYERLREVSHCHECSLILLEELPEKPGGAGQYIARTSSSSRLSPSSAGTGPCSQATSTDIRLSPACSARSAAPQHRPR